MRRRADRGGNPAGVQFLAVPGRCARVANLMPGIRTRVSTKKPGATALSVDTLGAKLKRRRLEKGQRQIDAAREMGVDQHSVINWEKGLKEPMAAQYPTIISFLGYEPWPEPSTLPEKLVAARLRCGWSIKRTAATLGIDEGTLGRWERGAMPAPHHRSVATAFAR